jgi:hypothetical protein
MFPLFIKKIPILLLFTFQILFPSFRICHTVKKEFSKQGGFALVELFTSEGCSSCPPADEAVGRLKGWKNNVYVLSFHVDYWNHLGWKDLFSNASYSRRQQDYGSIFHLSSIYTPQIVVNGRSQFVGSDESRLRETIEASLKEIPGSEIRVNAKQANKNQILVSCITTGDPELKLNLALVQNFTKDFIQRGENKGETLNHYYTVRDFRSLSDQTGTSASYLDIPTGSQLADLTVIAFLQNPKTGNVVAATQSSLL